MKNSAHIYTLFLLFIFYTSCSGQNQTDLPKDHIKSKTKSVIATGGPGNTTRNIIQDKRGNIWIAAYDGIFRYDGKSFTNIIRKVSSARFFSILEDKNGNFWFGSIGSGVYFYDGKSFRNFKTSDGLAGNNVACVCQDRTGNIWFGTGSGASRYDGESFRNFTTKEGLSDNDVNSIMEDKTGKLWFGTRGNACIYDGNTFTILTHYGKPFTSVRSIIEDKKGSIWLGGHDGLWRYDGNTFTNLKPDFVGYVMEDRTGNIWTSSERENSQPWAVPLYDGNALSDRAWMLSRYDEKSLSGERPIVTEINPKKGMICGILEANDGSIWFGAFGVYRYDGNTIIGFNGDEGEK